MRSPGVLLLLVVFSSASLAGTAVWQESEKRQSPVSKAARASEDARAATSSAPDGEALTSAPSAAVAEEFNRLRVEGNDAVYNLEYGIAREKFQRLTALAPDHPAGFIYLANNLWLEGLNASRRLSSNLYSSASFYVQEGLEDKFDVKKDREFNDLIRQAVGVAKARLQKNPRDAEALYYHGAALGLRAGYTVTVKRSFRKAIGDANSSIKLQRQVLKLDPNYHDAYMSVGLYAYVIDSLPFVWRTLARFAGLKGSKTKGIENLELAASKGKYVGDDARVILIGLYSRENQPQKALDTISYLAKKYPRNYLFSVERGSMLYQQGRKAEGEEVFAALLQDERLAQTATDTINYQWGEALMKAGEAAAAVEKYRAVTRWAKSDKSLVTRAHLHAGQALDVLGKRAEAVVEYQTVLKRENVFDAHKQANEYVKKPYVAASAQKSN